MKHCHGCGKTKERGEFHNNRTAGDGLQSRCKPCKRADNRSCGLRRPDFKRANASAQLKHKYGITLDQYEQMVEDQGGVCRICGGVNASGQRLHVDHDHLCCPGQRSCGKCLRGITCENCNHAMGALGLDDPERRWILDSIAIYLEMAGKK